MFKRGAAKLSAALKDELPDAKVVINSERVRRAALCVCVCACVPVPVPTAGKGHSVLAAAVSWSRLLNHPCAVSSLPPSAVPQPRKGTFEVAVKVGLAGAPRVLARLLSPAVCSHAPFRRVQGKPVVSLQGMPRPFKKLRELDMDDTAKKTVDAVKAAQK